MDLLQRDTSLTLGSGRLSDDVRSLEPIRVPRLDVATAAQNALHIPVLVSVPAVGSKLRSPLRRASAYPA